MDGSIVSMDERARIMSDFRRGDFDILLVSEVGSEGLDFEFCGALVNYDLPWNPMRVEQRIGRLDRFGQKFERIHIFNFHVPGTIETDIFERLYERIRVFEESIGELEPIIRDDLAEVTRIVVDPRRSDAERERELDRIEVALENRRSELAEITSATTSVLSGFDGLLIDGLERDTIAGGKYVGESEIEGLVTAFVESFGGRIRRPGGTRRLHELTGTPEVAQRAQSALDGQAHASLDPWVAALRDAEPIQITFSPDRAMETSATFLHLGHPIVRAAALHMTQHHLPACRVGQVTIRGDRPGRYAALLSIIKVNGIRPQTELRAPTIELTTGGRADEIGELLLACHARGELLAADDHVDLMADHVEVLERAVEALRDDVEARYQSLNDALVDGRRLTLERTMQSKIRRAQATLSSLQRNERSESIQRLHRGRIANLENKLAIDLERLDEARAFSVTWSPAAIVVVDVASPAT
jgi:hypothetical protein